MIDSCFHLIISEHLSVPSKYAIYVTKCTFGSQKHLSHICVMQKHILLCVTEHSRAPVSLIYIHNG